MAVTYAEVTALVSVPEGTLDEAAVTASIAGQSNALRAAASVCRRLATFYASRTDVGAGGASVKSSQASKQWMELARDFDSRASRVAGVPIVNGACPGSAFGTAQFENEGRRGYDDDR